MKQFNQNGTQYGILNVGQLSILSSFSQCVQERAFPAVNHVDMMLTEDCNCRCDYCFVRGKRPKSMSEGVVRATIDFLLLKARGLSEVQVVLFGGEPLLVFDLARLAVDYGHYCAKRLGKKITYSMTTNGTLLDESKLRFCRDYDIKFLLSIDGDEKTHNTHRKFINGQGTYNSIVKGIPLMKEYQPWLGAKVTPTPTTLRTLSQSISHLHGLGINQFLIGHASGLEYSDSDVAEYKRQMLSVFDYYLEKRRAGSALRIGLFENNSESRPGSKRGVWGCGAGRGRISVSSSGEIQTCAKVQGLSNLAGIPEYSLGNVLTGFTNLEARRDFIDSHYELRKCCHSCEIIDDCSGGCPAVNFEATGCILLPDPNECRMMRAWIEVRRGIFAKLEAEGLLGPAA